MTEDQPPVRKFGMLRPVSHEEDPFLRPDPPVPAASTEPIRVSSLTGRPEPTTPPPGVERVTGL